jgi:hypothetical protein
MAFSFMIIITLSDFTPFSKLNLFPASDIGSFRVYCNTRREEGVREGATVKGHEIQRESDNSFAGPATLLLTSQHRHSYATSGAQWLTGLRNRLANIKGRSCKRASDRLLCTRQLQGRDHETPGGRGQRNMNLQ